MSGPVERSKSHGGEEWPIAMTTEEAPEKLAGRKVTHKRRKVKRRNKTRA